MTVLQTPRLRLRRLDHADTPFILRLVNEPSWLQNIGDKGVRTLDDALRYLDEGPLAMYARHGFGLYAVTRREDDAPIGLCGLIRRDTLPDADIGYAYLPEFWGQGFAREAAAATLEHARRDFGLPRLLAITAPHNTPSMRLLEHLGFAVERVECLGGATQPSHVYALALAP